MTGTITSVVRNERPKSRRQKQKLLYFPVVKRIGDFQLSFHLARNGGYSFCTGEMSEESAKSSGYTRYGSHMTCLVQQRCSSVCADSCVLAVGSTPFSRANSIVLPRRQATVARLVSGDTVGSAFYFT